jgi:probable HAF family extracellular repeat protein
LGDLPGGDDYSSALGINADGTVVGTSSVGTNSRHAFLWDSTTGMRDLGDLPGGIEGSTARAVNDSRVVVGEAHGEAGLRPFIWTDELGIRDLNDLIDPTSGWILVDAFDIDNSGRIVGYGYNPDGEVEAYLLTIIPEPSSVALLCVGVLGLVLRRRVKR